MSDKLEIEIKCYCDNPGEIESRIKTIGAEYIETRTESDIYFNHPSRDFAETDEAFRMRRVNSSCRITYKGPKVSKTTKARVEHETAVGDFDAMRNIILSLGFVESGIIEKKRKIFALGETEISIDDVKDLGVFIEIEIIGELKEEIEKKLFDTAAELGLTKFERRSYLELKYFS
ncbi:MAG TPA: class IV adenylate cyclase, partial [Spirochaetota bacterium]|nr:class IV adenylate cyclase [Spirochaetota bacterium]HPF07788.1 class IV adenylate cyclase [Spirochaetota bacterium]HRX49249.1 class IV adenylate cyclase [Spirochaetota bacterium]